MSYELPNLDNLPTNAQIPMSDLITSKTRGKRGYTRLSEAHIRRLEATGNFPSSRKIKGTRCRFYVAGEIRQWLKEQAEG